MRPAGRREVCLFDEGQDFDPAYHEEHASNSVLPPYSSPCNAGHDRVPGWGNPAIVATAVLCGMSVAGLLLARAGGRPEVERPPTTSAG